jgi:hypothetical protein
MADSLEGWEIKIQERSARVYEGIATHVTGASFGAINLDPEQLLEYLRKEARTVSTEPGWSRRPSASRGQ